MVLRGRAHGGSLQRPVAAWETEHLQAPHTQVLPAAGSPSHLGGKVSLMLVGLWSYLCPLLFAF